MDKLAIKKTKVVKKAIRDQRKTTQEMNDMLVEIIFGMNDFSRRLTAVERQRTGLFEKLKKLWSHHVKSR